MKHVQQFSGDPLQLTEEEWVVLISFFIKIVNCFHEGIDGFHCDIKPTCVKHISGSEVTHINKCNLYQISGGCIVGYSQLKHLVEITQISINEIPVLPAMNYKGRSE